ncbi:hypothetical protein YTXLTZUM_CDS0047 [Enterococcus phage VRE9_3]
MFKQCFKVYVQDNRTGETEIIFVKGEEKNILEKLFDTIISDLKEDKTKTITIDMSEVF